MPRHQAPAARLKEAQRLKRLRAKLGMTMRDLGKEFRASPSAIAQWENGDRTIPGPTLRLIEIYEATPSMRRSRDKP